MIPIHSSVVVSVYPLPHPLTAASGMPAAARRRMTSSRLAGRTPHAGGRRPVRPDGRHPEAAGNGSPTYSPPPPHRRRQRGQRLVRHRRAQQPPGQVQDHPGTAEVMAWMAAATGVARGGHRALLLIRRQRHVIRLLEAC